MTIINGYFDELEFWDSCYFGKPIIKDNKLVIPVRNLGIYETHPLNNTDELIVLQECKLVFCDVQKSERIVYEYLGEPKSGQGFKPSYKVNDGLFMKTAEPITTFFLEGVWEDPPAYVTWEINSVSFYLEV
ncbi:MAG TPA: hypothetical protein DCL61_11360 [Cyanobacteria bacterium UBA12227]|nr:hypothetical protein [Cyanobacteria bacterium UBA12227]HAX90511.1 hypothetical protein [Cyanobacteria bacterium UBA11370]